MLQAAAGDLLSGDRRGRQEQPEAWIAGLQVRGERARRQRLPDRDGMDPDRLFTVDVERHRQMTATLPQTADVLLVDERLKQEIRRDDDEDGQC